MRISISRYHSYLLQNEKTEKSIYTNDHANSITDELSASDSSSDDDIIIDRTEDSKDKSQTQVSEDSHMEIDNAQQTDDREYTTLLNPSKREFFKFRHCGPPKNVFSSMNLNIIINTFSLDVDK